MMSARPETPWKPPAMLLELAAGDEELIPTVVDAFRQDTTNRLTSARAALTNTDRVALRNEIHAIKGGARQVGADSFAALCQQLELAAPEAPELQLAESLNGLETQFRDLCLAMTLHFSSSQPPSSH